MHVFTGMYEKIQMILNIRYGKIRIVRIFYVNVNGPYFYGHNEQKTRARSWAGASYKILIVEAFSETSTTAYRGTLIPHTLRHEQDLPCVMSSIATHQRKVWRVCRRPHRHPRGWEGESTRALAAWSDKGGGTAAG